MQKLSEAEIVSRIENGVLFECEIDDGSFAIKIESYVPSVCTAIHAGHTFRRSLEPLCHLSDLERLYEEDPLTELFIRAMPITLVARDSRYEYDLNRPLSTCVYKEAWGRKVWRKPLPAKERKLSIGKHQQFYRVIDALLAKLEAQFGAVLVVDMHSYNYLRHQRRTPTFNLGTEQMDLKRWSRYIEFTEKRLGTVDLPNLPVTVARNDVFHGRGYLAAHANSRFENVLVLPLEVQKVYMDELEGTPYPLVLNSLSTQIKDVLLDISMLFSRNYTRDRVKRRGSLLADKMDPAILTVDRQLFAIAKGLDTLHYINPANLQSEKKKFFRARCNYDPQFHYRPLKIDPYVFRESLYRLPVAAIRDAGIQTLYRDVIDNLARKIDLLVKIGRPEFLYESLRYYGEPSIQDEKNAAHLLHCASYDEVLGAVMAQEAIIEMFKYQAAKWDMPCKVEVSNRLVANAMVSDSKKAVLLSKGAALEEKRVKALVHHELGVHMATTLNASMQKLKVFRIGLPGNTLTQEGLAILNEYLSGNLVLSRLKVLGLRVLAVKEMLRYGRFQHTYGFLLEEHRMSPVEAFQLAVRVHRGGGFTKDYLYLNGVALALEKIGNVDIRNLFTGKTSFAYLPIINEMVERQMVTAPAYLPEYLGQPAVSDKIIDYLMSCIRYEDSRTIRMTPPEEFAVSA
ncbi:flavohemoglobin expression-modulating QEGLA motif protein [bacterium]|nr:flavohemoglobin expression-modulating QEGLA motif protein [bacterium]